MPDELVHQDTSDEAVGLTDQAAVADGRDTDAVTEIELDGEKFTPAQIKEWKAGHMMEADYTRKTQELSQQRESLKPYEELATYLKANPTQAQDIYGYLQGTKSLNGQEINPLETKVQQLERMQNQILLDNSRREVSSKVEAIKNDPSYEGLFKNPEMEKALMAVALQTGDLNLENVAKGLHKTMVSLRAGDKMAVEKQIKDNLNKPTRKDMGGTPSMGMPKGFDLSKASDKQMREEAKKFLS